MSKALDTRRLADAPFKLIETPAHAQKSSKPYDQYVEAASVMALGHNVFIRGMNSIYKQAPHIKPEDHADFINYAKCWAEILDAHHKMEETSLFPQIEAKTGEIGIMEVSVEQHHAFLPGLAAYKEYLSGCTNKPDTFSGTRLISIIDSFAPELLIHLSDEIPTLLALSKFGNQLRLLDMVNAESQKSPLHQSITGGTPFFFRNLDVEFEDGIWKQWPPIPAPVWWFLQNSFVAWNSRWWRFAGCDASGKLRELPTL
ncbi:uncharacterized protein LY89DRAFT_742239 [Mollisia scopiformis]|uniref:Hemerythrin-like domain-containing protein n=1 Tax=Mollisia scopiformis TaxID=149040 RepID=A0A132B6A6_MOLSC|nr:uncharacterized protein LY89DRAFT_742239 [Mollisia scopiformis]KUJ07940.1 hypothetical protein LY89DRAFT_742239 [Mollisia scopiformis]